MKNRFRFLSIMLVFVLALSFQSSLVYAKSNIEKSRNNNITPISIGEINYEANKNLTEEQVNERFGKINSMYKINEPFSSEDTEFIRAYASSHNEMANLQLDNTAPGITPNELVNPGDTTSGKFDKYKTFNGITVNFYGTLYSTINYLNHSYRGNVTAYIVGGTKVQNIKVTITGVAYGIIGTSGTYIGIVYNGSTSGNLDNATRYSMDRTVIYPGIGVVYTYTNAYTTITTSSGSFNLYGF